MGDVDNTTLPVPVDEVTPVPPLATATVPVTLAAVPVMLPTIGLVTVKLVNVPNEVKDELTTVEFKDVPDKVPAAAVTVMSDEPSNATPLMFFVAANLVAVAALPVTFPVKFPVTLPVRFPVTFPVKFAVIVPAVKFPLASRATIAEAVFASVAVVAELLTLPGVAIVANLVSMIAAEVEMSALTISPSFILSDVTALLMIFTVVMASAEMTGAAAVVPDPAKSPANCTLPVAAVVAFGAPEVTLAST